MKGGTNVPKAINESPSSSIHMLLRFCFFQEEGWLIPSSRRVVTPIGAAAVAAAVDEVGSVESGFGSVRDGLAGWEA